MLFCRSFFIFSNASELRLLREDDVDPLADLPKLRPGDDWYGFRIVSGRKDVSENAAGSSDKVEREDLALEAGCSVLLGFCNLREGAGLGRSTSASMDRAAFAARVCRWVAGAGAGGNLAGAGCAGKEMLLPLLVDVVRGRLAMLRESDEWDTVLDAGEGASSAIAKSCLAGSS